MQTNSLVQNKIILNKRILIRICKYNDGDRYHNFNCNYLGLFGHLSLILLKHKSAKYQLDYSNILTNARINRHSMIGFWIVGNNLANSYYPFRIELYRFLRMVYPYESNDCIANMYCTISKFNIYSQLKHLFINHVSHIEPKVPLYEIKAYIDKNWYKMTKK